LQCTQFFSLHVVSLLLRETLMADG